MDEEPIHDRREADRIAMKRPIRFQVLDKGHAGQWGLGQTINISRSSVLFASDQAMCPGDRVEVEISWPAQLDVSVDLQLVAVGRIVRCEQGVTAVQFQSYQFRTAPRNTSNLLTVVPAKRERDAPPPPLPDP